MKLSEKIMPGKTGLTTGANSGIGRATAVGLVKKGATMVMVCRNQNRGESGRN